MKEYETLLELDATGSEFNLACILIGLERDPRQGPFYQFSEAPLVGPRVPCAHRLVGRRQAARDLGRRGAAQSRSRT